MYEHTLLSSASAAPREAREQLSFITLQLMMSLTRVKVKHVIKLRSLGPAMSYMDSFVSLSFQWDGWVVLPELIECIEK